MASRFQPIPRRLDGRDGEYRAFDRQGAGGTGTIRSAPEGGPRACYAVAMRMRGSRLHMAVDTLGHLLALHVTPADVDDRAEVGRLSAAIQEATSQSMMLAHVNQGFTGQKAIRAARAESIELHVGHAGE